MDSLLCFESLLSCYMKIKTLPWLQYISILSPTHYQCNKNVPIYLFYRIEIVQKFFCYIKPLLSLSPCLLFLNLNLSGSLKKSKILCYKYLEGKKYIPEKNIANSCQKTLLDLFYLTFPLAIKWCFFFQHSSLTIFSKWPYQLIMLQSLYQICTLHCALFYTFFHQWLSTPMGIWQQSPSHKFILAGFLMKLYLNISKRYQDTRFNEYLNIFFYPPLLPVIFLYCW